MTNPEPKAADVPSASTDEVRAWDTALARKPAADGLREALERLAGHDTRDPGLTYDNPEQLVQSAAQAAKDILAALASPSIEGQAGEESKEWSLACTLAGAELNYRNSYEQRGAYHIETGRRWDKMRCAGDAIRTHEPASVSPHEHCAADAPDDDDNTMREDPMFNRGVQHVVDLLAKTLRPLGDWYSGDGSEDYDCDLDETLRNILAAKGLLDKETGEFAAPPAPVADRAAVIEAIFDKMQPLIGQLTNFQTQLDQDGICVGVSRQALNELFEFIEELRSLAPKGAA